MLLATAIVCVAIFLIRDYRRVQNAGYQYCGMNSRWIIDVCAPNEPYRSLASY
jgi:hypothetical protein